MKNTDINKEIFPKGYHNKSFETIKRDLIDMAKQNKEIKDFDYEASVAHSIVNMMSYVLAQHQYMTNMSITESNIHTAKTIKMVKAHAQAKGYVLNGISSSRITVAMECSMRNDEPVIKIPRGTKFLGSKVEGGESFSFVTTEDVNSSVSQGGIYIPFLSLSQGIIMRVEKSYNDGYPIILKDTDIDRKTIKVWVDGAEWKNWTENNIVDVNGGSRVFYVRENMDEETQIYFGTGTINPTKGAFSQTPNYVGGLKPKENSKIVIEYLRTKGNIANGCKHFVYADTIKDMDVHNIMSNYDEDPNFVGSMGGGILEDIESIRENGIRAEESQRRMVTPNDWLLYLDQGFKTMIQTRQVYYPNEGKDVYVSIKPIGTLNLTSNQRQEIVEYLSKLTIGKFNPIVINPIYLFIRHDINVSYNPIELNESRDWLDTKIRDNVFDYYKEEIEIFGNQLHKSKLLAKIDSTDQSVKGSSANLSLVREVSNYYQTSYKGIQFFNEILQGGFSSTDTTFVAKNIDEITLRRKTYPINIQGAKRTGTNSVIIAGPFVLGDIDKDVPEYKGTDITRRKLTNVYGDVQDRYYEIGKIDHFNDLFEWSFAKIKLNESNFAEPFLEINAKLVNDNIITAGDGALMIYERDIRPQYLNLNYNIVKR